MKEKLRPGGRSGAALERHRFDQCRDRLPYGKAKRRQAHLRHGMVADSRGPKRQKGSSVVVAAPDQARVLRMLGQR